MRIGVVIVPTDPWPDAVARSQELERLGFAHVWTYDHLSWQRFRDEPWYGAIPWLAGIAASTEHIRLGTLVTSPNFRHPLTLAKDAMTIDHISGGRLTLGIGAGGTGFDATAMGAQPLSPGERAARFGDFLEMLDGLLCHPAQSAVNGHYSVVEARTFPGCVQRPRVPFAVAAAGPRTIALAARYGSAWVTFGDPTTEEPTVRSTDRTIRRQLELLEAACAAIGRDPATIDRIYLTSNREDRPLASLEAFEAFLGRFAALGFTDVVFHDPRPGDPIWNDDPGVVTAIAEHLL